MSYLMAIESRDTRCVRRLHPNAAGRMSPDMAQYEIRHAARKLTEGSESVTFKLTRSLASA